MCASHVAKCGGPIRATTSGMKARRAATSSLPLPRAGGRLKLRSVDARGRAAGDHAVIPRPGRESPHDARCVCVSSMPSAVGPRTSVHVHTGACLVPVLWACERVPVSPAAPIVPPTVFQSLSLSHLTAAGPSSPNGACAINLLPIPSCHPGAVVLPIDFEVVRCDFARVRLSVSQPAS